MIIETRVITWRAGRWKGVSEEVSKPGSPPNQVPESQGQQLPCRSACCLPCIAESSGGILAAIQSSPIRAAFAILVRTRRSECNEHWPLIPRHHQRMAHVAESTRGRNGKRRCSLGLTSNMLSPIRSLGRMRDITNRGIGPSSVSGFAESKGGGLCQVRS